MVSLRLRLPLLAAAATAAAALAVPAANAGLISGLFDAVLPTCGAVSQPFLRVDGDASRYCALANNGFELGSAGWGLSAGASIAFANEPWYVSGFGWHALDLAPGATATSPAVPISLLDPYFRMFARSLGANAGLRVQIVFHGLTGNLTGLLNFGEFAPGGYGSWSPSRLVPSLLALPLGTSWAQVRLTSLASSGHWQVDDVFVDPWRNI